MAQPVLVTLLPVCSSMHRGVCQQAGLQVARFSLKHKLGSKAADALGTIFCSWQSPKGSKTTLVNLTDSSDPSVTTWIQIPDRAASLPPVISNVIG